MRFICKFFDEFEMYVFCLYNLCKDWLFELIYGLIRINYDLSIFKNYFS